MRRVFKIFLVALLLLILLIAGYLYWRHGELYPSTDDAYVEAHKVVIAPEVSGRITKVLVANHQYVHKGQLLFLIDQQFYRIKLEDAIAQYKTAEKNITVARMAVKASRAEVKQRQAELIDTQVETRRALVMAKRHFYSSSQRDLAIKNLAVAKAALHAAESQLAEAIAKRGRIGKQNAALQAAAAAIANAKLNLSHTAVYAPSSGYIANFDLRIGAMVSAAQNLFALIEDHHWWIKANFKETSLARMKVGQPVKVILDMYPHQYFHGVLASVGPGSGASFSLLPAENTSGNWVKVTQRFPVNINIKQVKAFPLRIGASATVVVDTH